MSDTTRTRILYSPTCDTNKCKSSYSSKILEIGIVVWLYVRYNTEFLEHATAQSCSDSGVKCIHIYIYILSSSGAKSF